MSDPTELQLCLLRHAHAGDPMKWSSPDADRPLSEKGRRQAERMGLFLARTAFRPDVVLSSPKLRAIETARLVTAPLNLQVVVEDALGELLTLDVVERVLMAHGNPRRPMLVGHDPDFSDLAAALSGSSQMPMRKGALVRIDVTLPIRPGSGILRWLVPPELLALDD